MMNELTDPEQMKLCAQGLAGQPNQLEEILPVLYHLRQREYSLGELFPNGIRLNMDLSKLNLPQDIPEGDDPLPADSRGLVITRTETKAKAEQLKEEPGDGYSWHDKSDPSSFDVCLETVWMDRMLPEQMPAAYADCQWLAVLDMQYVYGGCITKLKDFATGKEEQGQHYYPVYGCLCRLMLAEPDSLEPRRLISSLSADADKDQVVSRWTNTTVGTSVSTYRAAPDFDGAWKDDALRQFLNIP